VQRLERDGVGLDESVELFREGKALSARCETLLRGAQQSIEAAARGEAQPPAAAGVGVATPLFGRDVDDADPDL